MTGVVRVTRTINAPAQTIFDAWTDAEQLQQWMCPEPAVLGHASCDPVVGGRYRLVMVSPNGSSEITGEYLAVEPPRRLVFTWRSDDIGQESRVSVLLQPAGEATEMTIIHERVPADGPYDALASGWGHVAGRLERLVAAAQA